jgi:hypothetical protein
MQLKKILSGIVAAMVAATTMAFAPLASAEEGKIEINLNVSEDYFGAVIFTNETIDYSVNDNSVTATGKYWVQIDRSKDDKDTVYAGAFGDSTVDGAKQSFTFSVPANDTSISLKTVSWSNDASKNIGHEVTIDTTKAVNNELSVQLVADGDVSDQPTNNWYYLQPVEVKYLTKAAEEPKDDPEEVPDGPTGYVMLYNEEFEVTDKYEGKQIPVETASAGDKITVTYKLNDAATDHQLSFKHAGKDWPSLTSPEYTDTKWKTVEVREAGTFTFTLNKEDAVNITANNLVISGKAVTYTKVELNADKKPAEEPKDDPAEESPSYTGDEIKENTIVKQTTAVVDGAYNSRLVKKVSADDIKNATEIEFTLSNGTKTIKVTSTKCYTSLSANGSSVDAGNGFVFLTYTIKGIPEGVTVTCTDITIK